MTRSDSSIINMPKRLPWALLYFQIPAREVDSIRDAMKYHTSTGSNEVSCTVCSKEDPHTMRYRTFKCASPSCAAASVPDHPCKWRLKTVTCHERDIASIFSSGEHIVQHETRPRTKLTETQKAVVRTLTSNGVTPLRILNAIADDMPGNNLPMLRTLQNFVAYFRRTELDNTDDIETLVSRISEAAYRGDEDDIQPFAFSSDLDSEGVPVVGDGSDDEPFSIGYTTKRMLKRMDRPVESFVFHIDATFKTNQVDYPLFVCGISDPARTFHLVALFVTSQRQEKHIATLLTSLRYIYGRVVGKPLGLRYVVGDADGAQFNAVETVFHDSAPDYLMCFFHVVTKIYEHKNGASNAKIALAVADIYDMHFAKSASQFVSIKTGAVRRWKDDPETAAFGRYFNDQWLKGKFVNWQCFHTPSGFASTNNPVEQFNGKLKKAYTLRSRMKMGLLLRQISKCCNNESKRTDPFNEVAVVRAKLNVRATELRRQGDIVVTPPLDDEDDDGTDRFVMVMSIRTPMIKVKKLKKMVEVIEIQAQIGINAARMERDEQPAAGWAVDIVALTCPCKYFGKYGKCVHLLLACYVRFGVNDPSSTKKALVNRSKKRTLQAQIVEAVAAKRASSGRPLLNGPAWSFV
jgi:hypothetical protein